jgi:hypothetical protein
MKRFLQQGAAIPVDPTAIRPFSLMPRMSGDAQSEEIFRENYVEMARQVRADHGMDAFVNDQRATAVHEAGHCVVAAAHGGTVSKVWIKRKRIEGNKVWVGMTYHGMPLNITPDTTAADDEIAARNQIAGVLAELVLDRENFRAGSSIDEITTFRMIVATVACKTGCPHEEVGMRLIGETSAVIDANRGAIKAIADALMRCRILRGHDISDLLKGIVPVAAAIDRVLSGEWRNTP